MNLSAVYDQDFFEMHVPWRAEYDAIADWLTRALPFSTVIDLGAGNGFLLARLMAVGKDVRGVDGSMSALEAAPKELLGRITQHDLSQPLPLSGFDLVICTEVAEHLDFDSSKVLLDTVCSNRRGFVYFTAAVPGQGGHHHVNEQPHSFWIREFAERGYTLVTDITNAFRTELSGTVHTAWWLVKNAMIYRAP